MIEQDGIGRRGTPTLVVLACLAGLACGPALARWNGDDDVDPCRFDDVPTSRDARAGVRPMTSRPESDVADRVPRRLPGIDRPGASGRPHWRRNLFKRVVSDQRYLLTTWVPAEARRPSVYSPVLAAGAMALDSNVDRPGGDVRLSRSVGEWGRGSRPAAEALSFLGDAETGIALVGGSYLIGRWTGNTRLARASSLSAEAMINAGIWSSTLKVLTRRARPSSSAYGGQFGITDPTVEKTSFPSGHAMGSFAVATVVAGEYRDKRWVRWLAYGTAGLIGLSRVALERHYVSDVIVGGLLGHSLGRMVLSREGGLDRRPIRGRFQPTFEPTQQGYGVVYRHTW